MKHLSARSDRTRIISKFLIGCVLHEQRKGDRKTLVIAIITAQHAHDRWPANYPASYHHPIISAIIIDSSRVKNPYFTCVWMCVLNTDTHTHHFNEQFALVLRILCSLPYTFHTFCSHRLFEQPNLERCATDHRRLATTTKPSPHRTASHHCSASLRWLSGFSVAASMQSNGPKCAICCHRKPCRVLCDWYAGRSSTGRRVFTRLFGWDDTYKWTNCEYNIDHIDIFRHFSYDITFPRWSYRLLVQISLKYSFSKRLLKK